MTVESIRISARALAEFVFESGDLWLDAQSIARMQDGIRGHLKLQAEYPPDYRAEVPVRLDLEFADLVLNLHGRIDGLGSLYGIPLIEEIKTTALNPAQIGVDDYPVHWAQALIYAHIIAQVQGESQLHVRLTYYNLSGQKSSFTRQFSAQQLEDIVSGYVQQYLQWLRPLLRVKAKTRSSAKQMRFPYQDYRDGQHEMSRHSYWALKDRKKLLCQAPTGIGKTSAALFPAIKALGEGLVSHVFYLTARGTTQQAALSAVDFMRAQGLHLRAITLTAKDKICPYGERRCHPEDCDRARGYFDRRRAAMLSALEIDNLDKPAILSLAEKFDLCPFELSLDISETADVVICDYNYAFDPRVKLKRFFMDKGDYALLIDEAHNLPDRAREMLSAQLNQKDFSQLRTAIGKIEGRKSPLYKQLTTLLKAFKSIHEAIEEPTSSQTPPQTLCDAASEFADFARPLLSESHSAGQPLADCVFACINFVRVCQAYDEDFYTTLYQPSARNTQVKLLCFDPSKALADCFKKVRGAVLFSATLSPLSYYADLLSIDEEQGDALLSLPSPFPPDRLQVLRIALPTRYRQREQSATSVAQAIAALCQSHRGNYLACFPSHAYLRQIAEIFAALAPDVRVLIQQGDMDDAARQHFIDQFVEDPAQTMVAFIAMGGVFGEGIDLPGSRLSGAAIVGVGLPQINLQQNVLAQLYNDRFDDGFAYAYQYPGMCRVLQAAGRVIRSETDLGAVLLLDDRFFSPQYEQLLPPYWQIGDVRTIDQLKTRLNAFWQRYMQ